MNYKNMDRYNDMQQYQAFSQKQQLVGRNDYRVAKSADDGLGRMGIQEQVESSVQSTRIFKIKLDEAKRQFKGSIEKVDKQYKDMVQTLQYKLDKQHDDLIASIVAQKAEIDGEINSFFHGMAKVQNQAHADKLEELELELQRFMESQSNLKNSLLYQMENKRNAITQTAQDQQTSECQTMLFQDTTASQTLKSLMDSEDTMCQTLSMNSIFEDYEIEKMKREDEEKRRLDRLRKEALRKFRRDLMQLFQNCTGLKSMLASIPHEAYPGAIEKWKSIGPVSIDYILKNSDLDDLEVEARDLEFKRMDTEHGDYVIGFFKRGTDERHGICRHVVKNGMIFEGIFRNGASTNYCRYIYSDGYVEEYK